ncbi:MAG: hypothetical protein AAF958_11575, partial [Planctomycetota bacterium]
SVTHRAIQIAGLQMLWDASAWPRQAMTAAHWNRLVDAIGDSTHPGFSLPGSIDVRRRGDTVCLVWNSRNT